MKSPDDFKSSGVDPGQRQLNGLQATFSKAELILAWTQISALSCHGDDLHPDKARAEQDRGVSRKTILLAEKLGIPVVGLVLPSARV